MDLRWQMDAIYSGVELDRIPWNLEDPPTLLRELVESGSILPCAAVDLGCGAGNYAAWLASRGFRVTGIDLSAKAIELAQACAARRGVECRFVAADMLGELKGLERSFDFAYDWEVLHHIFPGERQRYVRNVHHLLRPDGEYLSVCFSERDPGFGGVGKYRQTPLGTTLYFSSEEELRALFMPLFRIQELRTVEIAGKHGSHWAVVARMKAIRVNQAASAGGTS